MSLKFKKISGSTPYLLNSASTAEELTLALEDYMRTGAQIIFQHDGEDCILTSFEYKSGIESTVIAYFVTPKKKLLKVDIGAGYDLVITESDIAPDIDITWENLQDKPFGEITENLGDTITWDGNIDTFKGVVTDPYNDGSMTMRYVKVSDCIPTIDDINSGYTFKHIDLFGGEQTTELGEGTVSEIDGIIFLAFGGIMYVSIVPEDSLSLNGEVTFPEKGVYFTHMILEGALTYCKSFTIQNYDFGTITTIKKIDEKYLPDTILIKTDGAEVYLIVEDGATPAKLEDAFNENFGFIPQLIIEMVDKPPETMEEADQNNQIVPLNIVRSTGIVYANFGAGVMPFGVGFFRQDGFDKGWTTDVNAETEAGVYCVRTEKNVPTKEYVDNSIANAIGNAIGGSY